MRAEAAASEVPLEPEVESFDPFPLLVNDPEASARVSAALQRSELVVRQLSEPFRASEDFGVFADAAGCPSVFWHFGGMRRERFTGSDVELLARGALPPGTATNHSPHYAPDPEVAAEAGTRQLLAAAGEWLIRGCPSTKW